jgi:3-deoxy-7-phosphoheptulonate synthase
MIVLLRASASPADVRAVESAIVRAGAGTRRSSGGERIAIETLAPHAPFSPTLRRRLESLDGVECVLEAGDPIPRVTAAQGPVAGIGGEAIVLALGPCAVEDEETLDAIARAAKAAGATILRGGAFKPRTSPYAFQGLGEPGLALLRRVADAHGLQVISEATGEAALDAVAAHCEWIQLGARNMANYPLLRAAARAGRPVLLKRGLHATVEEWLSAAEYLLDGGAAGVALCERGVRSFEPSTRATLDLGGLVQAKLRTRLPVLADPSHAAGTRALVAPLARAAIAAGADGLLVECHADPGRARSDGPQALTLDELPAFAADIAAVARAVGRKIEVCSQPWPTKTPSRSRSYASPR